MGRKFAGISGEGKGMETTLNRILRRAELQKVGAEYFHLRVLGRSSSSELSSSRRIRRSAAFGAV